MLKPRTLLEQKLASWLERRHALAFSSGTGALRSALFALNLPPRSIVGVQAYNYPPVVLAVDSLGLRPILLDVDADDFTLGPDEVARGISAGARAIVVTPMHGWLGNLDRAAATCSRAGIPLIEDASRAYGAAVGGRSAGRFGVIAAFSMNRSKVLGVGEGGLLATDDPSMCGRAAALGLPLHEKASHVSPGYELGRGEKLVPHSAAVAEAIRLLDLLPDRIAASTRRFDETRPALTDYGLVTGRGQRGAWKDVAVRSKPPVAFSARSEFATNNILSWAPPRWRGGRRSFPGVAAAARLWIVENICGYDEQVEQG